MTKFTILLCAVFLVSGSQANQVSTYWVDSLQSLRETINATIGIAVDVIHDTVTIAKEKADAVVEELNFTADEVIYRLYEQIREQTEQIDQRVQEITKTAGSVDVSECQNIGDVYHVDIESSANRTIQCVEKKKVFGDEILALITNSSEKVLQNLTGIAEEALACTNEHNGVRIVVNALVCAKKASSQASWATKKSVPALKSNLTKYSHQLTSLRNSLSSCGAATQIFDHFIKESDIVVDEVKKCVEKKVAGESSATTVAVENLKEAEKKATSTTAKPK